MTDALLIFGRVADGPNLMRVVTFALVMAAEAVMVWRIRRDGWAPLRAERQMLWISYAALCVALQFGIVEVLAGWGTQIRTYVYPFAVTLGILGFTYGGLYDRDGRRRK